MRYNIICTTIFFFLYTTTASATIINVPADSSAIQGGINGAANGDTVLVQSGTYVENINFNGKNIVVGSLFLTTGDTSYISLTVIDGQSGSGRAVSFENGENLTALLCGFTITNGWRCGIYCSNSSPSLENVTVSGNGSYYDGGGIYCYNSSPSLENVTVSGNNVVDFSRGGGIYCRDSSPRLLNVTVSGNTAGIRGGGIYCSNSSPSLENVTVSGNTANSADGGGISCRDNSNPSLVNVTVSGNTASNGGGGISCANNSSPSFDPVNRCNIYLNQTIAGEGNDLRAWFDTPATIHVVVDTFTVMNPTYYHAFPKEYFTFDILQAKREQVDADLYVSPGGDDANGGLSTSDPLKTVNRALSIILADSLQPHTIYLADGIYSPSASGESFPLYMLDYVSLSGAAGGSVILDAEGQSRVLEFHQDQGVTIENLNISGGVNTSRGGGITCYESNPSLLNLTVSGNTAVIGGGIYCENSSPSLVNLTVSGNTASALYGGGIYCYKSSPSLVNVTLSGNTADKGGGIYLEQSDPSLSNVTVSGNTANEGGGIFYRSALEGASNPVLINTIFWNNSPQEIYFFHDYPNSITITYSDVHGGEAAIVTNNTGTVNWLEGNINADPLFVDAANGDFHFQVGSPCIDVGTAFFVWEGDTLINLSPEDYVGTAPDMGAFEYGAALVIDNPVPMPTQFSLYQNHPNPFNPITTLHYDLPEQAQVTLVVYDLMGREVARLVDRDMTAGYHQVIWDGRTTSGREVPSGIYIARLVTPGHSASIKMLLMK